MTHREYSGYQSFTLKIDILTSRAQKIILKVYDASMKNTFFTNRYMVINGKQSLYVRMPVSGLVSVVEVYDEATGVAGPDQFKVRSISKIPLERKLDVVDFSDPNVKSFVKFATRFCYNAGVMLPGTYNSSDGRFSVIYSPQIVSSVTGQAMNTPARINKDNGQMEIAQSKFITMTVPMRMAILLHEFSHYFMNNRIDDETEADLNALLIYLGLGYPRIEACEAFLDTFIKSAQGPRPLTDHQKAANARRYHIIHRFIEDFENNNMVMKDQSRQ
jgi:hypothetical protein